MPIPDFQKIMRPLLEEIENGKTLHLNDFHEVLSKRFQLTPEEIKQRVPSGQQQVFRNKITWAASHLKKAGLVVGKGSGHYAITELGKSLLNNNEITTINLSLLKTLPLYQNWERTFGQKENNKGTKDVLETLNTISETPEIVIGNEILKTEQSLKYDLLDLIRSKEPEFFEYFVLELLSKMGYGLPNENMYEVVGQSGDGGIDGIIYQDKLKLDKIYIQAKRWKDNKVTSKDIRDFIGALNLRGAVKGVFITTSFFTPDAKSSSTQNPHNRIVLIDGEELADLALRHNVGVQIKYTYELKELDKDFFE